MILWVDGVKKGQVGGYLFVSTTAGSRLKSISLFAEPPANPPE
ncbi:hypothetical protein DDI_2329 [Dickeya dianthicola RNS04.9]|nr:hypothetical protein DDI_2329 [Dickeya dianthicola RNS04.9]